VGEEVGSPVGDADGADVGLLGITLGDDGMIVGSHVGDADGLEGCEVG
jgi:hypothetical protein